ncbi:hypothetical protein GCM10011487_12680 [Steroidobacter agaridevorans]|uniref:Uncharacterized protein n=1 Tax=Steroidobacter agaridevorans TaxID=2695856 RepID=A0A829Y8R9_9GAMM|nr:hypothetical protein [Steroidobacter agaridevorans]GFE79268.1 hypothetical protein GCM10011487_12680 [Steroidobacter agaridevorans]
MTIYLLRLPNHEQLVPWEVGDRDARRYDIVDPENVRGCFYQAEANEDIWSALKRQTSWFVGNPAPFEKVILAPGQCYPRIARPTANHPDSNNMLQPLDRELQNEIAIAESQLRVLLRQLHRICQTVHPYEDNLNAYGHDIRNLLILASTEVESHWRAVLSANSFQRERYSTNDYVKLAPAMKLTEYAVSFPSYPWITDLRPFFLWGTTGQPTRELAWYDAYNKAKHDREKSFAAATLKNAFEAIAANAIMICAQFGFFGGFRRRFASELGLSRLPHWSSQDLYIRPMPTGIEWTPTNYMFSN